MPRLSFGHGLAGLCVILALRGQMHAQDDASLHDALSRHLNGRVESFTSEGMLTLRYGFDGPDELADFETTGMSREALSIQNGILVLKQAEAGTRSFMELNGLHFTESFTLRAALKLRWPDAGLIIGLADSSDRGGQTLIMLNSPLDERSSERGHVILRVLPGLNPLLTGRSRPAKELAVDRTHELALTLERGMLTLAIDGRLVATDPIFNHKSFQVFIGAAGAEIELDDLRLEGKVVDAALRKLLKSGAARESKRGRDLKEGKTAAVALARERFDDPLSPAVRRKLGALPRRAVDLVIKARDVESGDPGEAALLYEEAAVEAPDSSVLAWRAGRNLTFAGEHERALEALRLAVRLDPELAPAWRDLGMMLSGLEKEQEAEDAFRRALDLGEDDALAHALYGVLLQGAGRLREARDAFEAAREIRPASEAYDLLLRDLDRIQSPPEWERPFRAETEHYLITTDVSEEFATKVGGILGHYRRALEGIIPLPEGKANARSQVWIFDSRGEYNVFAGTLMTRAAERTAGVYHPSIKTLLLFDEVDREATFDTLFHEAFHQYLDHANRTPPIWFNEGMAELFGALRLDPETGEVGGIGIQSRRLQELRHVLAKEPERIPDLDVLMQMPKIAFYDPETASLNYAVAWSLCYFFVSKESQGSEPFARYSRLVLEGKSSEDAYAATFGAGPDTLAENFRAAWRRFIWRLP